MASAGGRPSWQAMASVKNFHRSARAPPAARRHAGHINRHYKAQATASINDFAVSLASHPRRQMPARQILRLRPLPSRPVPTWTARWSLT